MLHATAVGNVSVKVKIPDQQINECKLNNVLFVPDLAFNLISVSHFTSEGNNFMFCDNNCKLVDDSNNVFAFCNWCALLVGKSHSEMLSYCLPLPI